MPDVSRTQHAPVTAIRNGTVIDHIPAGQAMRVLEMLGINKGTSVPVSLVMNVPSKKMGTKDIIKVEDRELNQDELNRLALVAPTLRGHHPGLQRG
ncbi:MAG: hypothetical protein CM15mP78_14020 [Candidatus Poseidoniales archaeon]|nr:MAG: hypothetical protein CM15mP78_14020 [Candidatus Poseidoniales archaeon]